MVKMMILTFLSQKMRLTRNAIGERFIETLKRLALRPSLRVLRTRLYTPCSLRWYGTSCLEWTGGQKAP